MSAQSGDFLIPQLCELESELDEERKARVNAVTLKKKIETDMKDLEEQLEAANRVKEDALRQLKKYQQQVKDIQCDLDEARQARDEICEQAKENERKAKQLEADYPRGPTDIFYWQGGPTEVHILYPNKSQLQNLSTQKDPYFLLAYPKKSLSVFASANFIFYLLK